MTLMVSLMDQDRILAAYENERCATGSTFAGLITAFEKLVEVQDPQQQVACASRLLTAIQAALPLLGTQQDSIDRRSESVPAVYHMPLTTAQTLRKQADELDREDAIVNELRAALREHLAVMQLRKEHGVQS